MGARHKCFSLWSMVFIFCSSSSCCYAANTIARGQSIRDGETIISTGKKFALGFFSPGNSSFRYVGIWYHQIPVQSVVWVANRESPISGRDGVLKVGDDGNLIVLDGNDHPVWSTNVSAVSGNSTAALTDAGNLILRSNGSADGIVWDSFIDPTDTYLPDMSVYMNVQEGERRVFTCWRSANDPSPGRYSMGVDPRGSPQIVTWDGLNRRWRSGHWNGMTFTGVPEMIALYQYGFNLINGGNGEMHFTYTPSNSSDRLRFMIGLDGNERQETWNESEHEWRTIQWKPGDQCDLYNKCGTFGICNAMDTPTCDCIEGYVPTYPDQWNNGNWSGGCVRRTRLQCEGNSSVVEGEDGGEDGFFKLEGVKLPDFLDHVGSEDIEECEEKCLQNCSCLAYAFVSGINCMMWNGDLVDIRHFTDGGSTLYIRLADSELGGTEKVTKLVIIATVVVGTFLLGVSIWLLWRFKLRTISKSWQKNNELPEFVAHRSREFSTDFSGQDEQSVKGPAVSGPELTYFNISCVAAATNNFSDEAKLGQGGFGTVYKGKLPGGQEIAVKRLSKRSGQGLEEFKNEIILIARLQHRNLVRLLGCCIQGEEMMLIYEYMPNKSLDSFLFDQKKQSQLNWRRRFTIIAGIARGLLYLHRDSRLRIIHRDLKASNILLDEDMNPKISDFGMARIFGGNQNEANTNRVVGTYGYMAPEYAMEGLFSVKSDVYSFGVLLLEIVSGRKNTSFRSSDYYNIIGHAWDLWEGGKALELVDPSIAYLCDQNEVLRCIHLGMMCVQDLAIHRPTMSMVLLMLESQSTDLPMPREPTLTSMGSSVDLDLWKESHDMLSSNEMTVSTITGR